MFVGLGDAGRYGQRAEPLSSIQNLRSLICTRSCWPRCSASASEEFEGRNCLTSFLIRRLSTSEI